MVRDLKAIFDFEPFETFLEFFALDLAFTFAVFSLLQFEPLKLILEDPEVTKELP